jgi:hypothetical protein
VDIPQLWWPELDSLLSGRTSLERLVERYPRPFSRELIKEPNLTFFFDDLRQCFPAACFVFVARDPRDNLRSLLDRMGLPGDLGRFDPRAWTVPATWNHLLDRTAWRLSGDFAVELLAERWNRSADVYLEHKEDLVLVRYEDFVEEKVASISDLAGRIGRAVIRDIADRVDVPYQSAGNGDACWPVFFGEENLGRIEDLCHERMRQFGYEVSPCPS